MKKPGILNEEDGSWSMRRTLALLYSICSVSCLWLSAMNGMMAGVWAGIAAILAVLVLLGYTTIESLKSIAMSIKEKGCGKEE
ncbi:MAG: hypothetical protein BWX81_02364 [Spirochaetes bacterium ADurb.Bin110]|jgi:CHASE2 domain-containing sensor protein|nr:MAG: hypothetical protein BWX81_02364 [Spirochaetes bacterium ADurb.Bin110]